MHYTLFSFPVFLLGTCLFLSSCSFSTHRVEDPALLTLDQVVAERDVYIVQKEAKIERLKELTQVATDTMRYNLLNELFEEYNGFNTDSALYISRLMLREANELQDSVRYQRALIFEARCMAINGIYEGAKASLIPMESELFDANKAEYYKVCSSMYIWEAEFTTIPEQRQEAWDHIPALRDSTILYEKSDLWKVHEEALLIGGSYPEGGISLLLPVMDSLSADDENIRYIANSLGSFYHSLHRQDSALHFFTLSAICDLRLGVREHASLREVALLLFEQGDIQRAFEYMKCCIKDAELCKARLRTIEMAGDMSVIVDAYQHETDAHQRQSFLMMAILLLSLLTISLAMIYSAVLTRRIRRAKEASDEAREYLREANSRLEDALKSLRESNLSLQESNRIRDTYVLQYMRECSEAFGKLETYRQQLLHVANHDTYKQLQEAIRSSDFIDRNTRDFYLHFDETFLSLFPTFVEDFNALLEPEQRFPIPEGHRLTTELRVFALIRLGVSDSEQIARFLRLSTKTIFNYRAKARSRALNDRTALEALVMQI